MIDAAGYQWYAIHTKYKCEKYVAGNLTRKHVEAYVPLLERTKSYQRKIKKYEIPLISCYAFVKISHVEYVKVLQTEYVRGFVKFAGTIVPIPEKEILLLKRIVGEVKNVIAEPTAWVQGDRVEVISGSLTGLEGILLESKRQREFVVELETLGYQLRMTIDVSALRKTSGAVA